MRTASLRLCLIALPVLAAGCVGLRRGQTSKPVDPATTVAAVTSDSAAIARKADSVKAIAAALNTIPDSSDSSRTAAAKAADSALAKATADSLAKKPAKKPAAKPAKQCILDFTESPAETRLRYIRLPDSTSLTFIGGGFIGHCQGEKNRISADSAEQYEASGVLNLFGNVVYEEPGKMRIQSNTARYFSSDERLFAEGNVIATQLASGSVFRGPSIEYLREMPGTRPMSKVIAVQRPQVELIEKDSTGKPGVPIIVSANTMVDEGDSLLVAWGQVQINRETLVGASDSASFDKIVEKARLIRTASVINRDPDEPFRLFGDTIDMFTTDRKLDRVVALHKGNATSNEVTMTAEHIDLRFSEQKLERAFAFGTGRATANTSSQQLEADSIDIRLADERVRQVRAIGMAVATGTTDTLKLRSSDRDILKGDTVTAWFDSTLTPSDTSKKAQIQQIHALGNASSFFQIASKNGPQALPGLNYVRGVTIRIHFDSGQVRDVTVDSMATGLYLEPVPDSLADSTKVKVVLPPPPKIPPSPNPSSPSPTHPLSVPAVFPDSRRRS